MLTEGSRKESGGECVAKRGRSRKQLLIETAFIWKEKRKLTQKF